MNSFDTLNRFLFDHKHVRGELVQLDETIAQMTKNHQYPEGVKQLLSELVVATSLLTATIKFEGDITVQMQGDGPVSYISVNGDHEQNMRGMARIQEQTPLTGLNNLLGHGTLIITIRPKNGEPYQGVVALEHETIANCLAHYFEVSEQIPTKIWLFNEPNATKSAGILLQLLPDSDDKEQQLADFDHLCQLTETTKADEILSLPSEELLYRLFHQETVKLFEPQSVAFQCGCSKEKCLSAISQMQTEEIRSILEEQGAIKMTCDYCLTDYIFDEQALSSLINPTHH